MDHDRPLEPAATIRTARPSPDASAEAWSALARAAGISSGAEQSLADLAVSADGLGAARAWLWVWDPAGEALTAAAEAPAGSGPSHPAAGSHPPHPMSPSRLDALTRPVWERGGARCGAVGTAGLPWDRVAHAGAVTVARDGRAWGLLVVAWGGPGETAGRAVALETFARLAAAALAAGDAAEERARRARQGAALAECARAATQAGHLSEIVHRVVRLAAQGTGGNASVVWLADADGAPRLEVTHGPTGRRERLAEGLTPLAASVMAGGRPAVLDRVTDDTRLAPGVAASLSALAAFPLVTQGRALGVLAVVDPAPRRAGPASTFDLADLEFLTALAALLALTVEQAGQHEAQRHADQRLRELRARLHREERLATLGETALRVAHEARNPLASIAAFARRVHRAFPEDDPQRESLEIVLREVGRLERMIGETLAEAPGEPSRLAVESVNQSVQDVLQAVGETLVRRRVRLLKRLAPDLPALLVDPERVRRVVGNILGYALDSVPVGGRVRVESRRSGGYVQIEIAHDGPRSPGDLMEQLFTSFAGGEHGAGASTGLGVAQRIIREHGGEIRVRAEGDWSNVVSFTLPVAENLDRRRPGTERRQVRGERRRAAGG